MELTPRLHAIATQVPLGAKLADVGTDHGYLPVWLLVHGLEEGKWETRAWPGGIKINGYLQINFRT